MKAQNKTPNTVVKFLRLAGLKVDIKHQFTNGKGKQNLPEPFDMELASGTRRKAFGRCDVAITFPNGFKVSDSAICVDKNYDKKFGVSKAIERIFANLPRNMSDNVVAKN